MSHLAQRKVKFVFVSTDLQGVLLSYNARDRLIEQFDYQPGGIDYILLGYRPGGELALRMLAQNLPAMLSSDFQGQDARESVVVTDVATGETRLSSLNDFDMIMVIADEPQDVQGWMEQVHSQAAQVPLTLLLPLEAAPVVQPYLRSPTVRYLAGKSGALGYEQARGGEMGAAAIAASGQLPFAVAVFIALLLLGAVVVALGDALGGRKRS
jgi:hypothetical protein